MDSIPDFVTVQPREIPEAVQQQEIPAAVQVQTPAIPGFPYKDMVLVIAPFIVALTFPHHVTKIVVFLSIMAVVHTFIHIVANKFTYRVLDYLSPFETSDFDDIKEIVRPLFGLNEAQFVGVCELGTKFARPPALCCVHFATFFGVNVAAHSVSVAVREFIWILITPYMDMEGIFPGLICFLVTNQVLDQTIEVIETFERLDITIKPKKKAAH